MPVAVLRGSHACVGVELGNPFSAEVPPTEDWAAPTPVGPTCNLLPALLREPKLTAAPAWLPVSTKCFASWDMRRIDPGATCSASEH